METYHSDACPSSFPSARAAAFVLTRSSSLAASSLSILLLVFFSNMFMESDIADWESRIAAWESRSLDRWRAFMAAANAVIVFGIAVARTTQRGIQTGESIVVISGIGYRLGKYHPELPPHPMRRESSQMHTATITTTLMIRAMVGSIGIWVMTHNRSPTTHNATTI